jgi:hypothetical protein
MPCHGFYFLQILGTPPPALPRPPPAEYVYVQWLTLVSVWQDELWTVMEYMEGGSLADTLKERRLSEKADPGTAKEVLTLKRTFQKPNSKDLKRSFEEVKREMHRK